MNRKGPPQPYLCFFPFPMRQEDLAMVVERARSKVSMPDL